MVPQQPRRCQRAQRQRQKQRHKQQGPMWNYRPRQIVSLRQQQAPAQRKLTQGRTRLWLPWKPFVNWNLMVWLCPLGLWPRSYLHLICIILIFLTSSTYVLICLKWLHVQINMCPPHLSKEFYFAASEGARSWEQYRRCALSTCLLCGEG